MKKTSKFAMMLMAFGLLVVGCDRPETDELGGIEAKITSIQITNAGLSGGDIVSGVVDNEAFTVTFEGVPAETDLAAVKFSAKMSLGARLEKDVINFLDGADADATQFGSTLKVINTIVDKKGNESKVEQEYALSLSIKAAEKAPVLDKLVIRDEQGEEHTVNATNIVEGMYDGILCLGIPESQEATVVSVSVIPARAAVSFSAAEDIATTPLRASEPGMLTIEFMGLKTEYALSFAASPDPGAAWDKAVVHDFSVATGSRYVDLDEEMTRGGDFDGVYVLLANRTAPKVFKVEDLLNDNVNNPIALDLTGVDGGTHVVSAGRLAQGHIYLCNLSTACSATEPLKVYHYASATSKPEVVLAWEGDGLENPDPELYDEYLYTGRIGDNISISLDENGNGYAFFFKQEADNKFFRWTVTNFTEFSDVQELALPAVANYYGMMNPVGPDQYLVKSAYKEIMWLMDKDANKLNELEWAPTPGKQSSSHGCDPRVIEFNRARYIMLSNARRFSYWSPEGVNVWDITEGTDIVGALVKLQEHLDAEPDDETVSPIEPCYTYRMDSETISSACVALCNCVVMNGKLLIFTAAPHAGFALIEVPAAF